MISMYSLSISNVLHSFISGIHTFSSPSISLQWNILSVKESVHLYLMSNIIKDSNHGQMSLTLHKNLKEQVSAMPSTTVHWRDADSTLIKDHTCAYISTTHKQQRQKYKSILTIPGNEDGSDSLCAGTWPPELSISKLQTGQGKWMWNKEQVFKNYIKTMGGGFTNWNLYDQNSIQNKI